MSGYASNDHGYSTYGGGYASTPLIERYAITDHLDGPGTSAYARYGNVTAYAYESLNGAVFEWDVTQFGNLYQVATSYLYETETGSCSHYSYFGSDPDGLGGSGYGYHPTAAARYSASDRTSVTDGSYTTDRLTTVLYTSHTNGSYFQETAVQGSTFADGHFIPGSTVFYGSSSYYDAATGYTTTHAYPD